MSLAKLVPISRLKYLIKIRDISIDDATFQLHYKFTFTFLLVGSLLLNGEQFFGKAIQCLASEKSHVPIKVVQDFCWIEGTFTLPKGLMKVIGAEVAAPGVEQFTDILREAKYEKDEILDHSYYQWVGMVLFIQALCFYVPHFVWKVWEKQRLSGIVQDLNKIQVDYEKRDARINKLAQHLTDTTGEHNSYAFRYFLCEVMNLINVIIQMIFINSFLGGEFTTYGWEVFNFIDQNPGDRIDPMAKVFPKMTKCTFRNFGPSGDLQTSDHLCMLPLNILNEKIFTVFWFWYYFVLIFSVIAVVYRILVIGFPASRVWLMGSISVWRKRHDMSSINEFMTYSDWFILTQLDRNLDKILFKEVLGKYIESIEAREYNPEYPDLSDENDTEDESKV